MADKILLVDDDPDTLDGYQRTLSPQFRVDIADGAANAFAAIEKNGPYSVVISDMRMPLMSGAEFLGQVRQRASETVRMLLTGETDLSSAIEAVNQGNIFRFLTKPCEPEVLANAIAAGIKQYRLITSERELLEKTLLGSIKVLADVLSAVSPEAFGRSTRIAHYVRHILGKVTLPSPWCLDAAATLSQLGCITLEAETMQRAYAGVKLTREEQARFDAHPQAAMELLKNIPRLESASWMIGQQLKRDIPEAEDFPGFHAKELLLGAKILKLAVAFEELRFKCPSKSLALESLRDRSKEFESSLIDTLRDLPTDSADNQLCRVSTSRLRAGMILDQEIKNNQGVLVVAKGQELTSALIMRLTTYARATAIDKEVMAFVPK
jgi:response regulator RpfG family c-di-GMP phosphodiesterase